ncbi:MAG: hypothetical protein MI867_01155 [Pseudomonadales bacterium]|nr:hypothetical protein [Pseudomonadales bacterium]
MKTLTTAIFCSLLSLSSGLMAADDPSNPTDSGDSKSNVSINGYWLTWPELVNLQMHLGYQVLPGAYLYNPDNTCWVNTTTGASGCIANYNQSGIYTSRYGSGERNANGDWSHYSNAAGGGVGGTGDGCVYAFGWSNC